MVRTLAAALALALAAATPAAADLASEVVGGRAEPASPQLVARPPDERAFGSPNSGEHPSGPPAALGEVRIVPYPHPVRPFGVPNVSEFEPAP